MHIYTKIVFLTFIMLIIKSDKVNGSTETYEDETIYRLNKDVKPFKYTIHLTVANNIGTTGTFDGKVDIEITTNKTLNEIQLHSKMITINSIRIFENAVQEDNLYQSVKENKTLEMLLIQISKPLIVEKTYIISIDYSGILHDDMYGFYRSNYIDDNGISQWIATTQFQPTHARRAFPCFDEPEFKAKFEIKITHPREYHALSNAIMVESVEDPTSNTLTTKFKQTPKMSTYLIAFIVSKFSKIQQTVDSIQHGLWSPMETIGSGQYGFTIAPKLLNVMQQFTDVSYAISKIGKLDQVAIPDFSAGAMENWGLVTYRETALLWNAQESSAKNKERVASVVAHELAHMWFGNLITLDWWSHTWLNEGFARYYQYHATAKVENTWQLDHQFVVEQQQAVFIQDSIEGVQALTSNCYTPSQISSKFGSISYNKGASVIRMMEHFLGNEIYIKGIKKYFFETNHFGSTTPSKLWTAMQTSIIGNTTLPEDTTLADIMTLWTTKEGYPVVNVTLTNNETAYFTQERFLFNKTNLTEAEDYKWYVPISFTTGTEKNFSVTTPKLWLLPTKNETTNDIQNNTWIIVNIQETAYFRVNYNDTLYDRIEKALKAKDFDGIHVLNRAQLVDDVMNLARASYVTYKRAFDLANYLSNDMEYYPWYSALNAFAFLKRRTDSTSETSKYLDKYLLNLISNIYKTIAFEENLTHQIDIHKKVLILNWACLLGHSDCVNKAKNHYSLLEEKNIPVDPNIRSIVYCTELRDSNNRNSWDYLWNKFRYSRWAPESVTLITALGCTKNKVLLEEYLMKSINPYSGIRDQDTLSVFTAVISGNPEGVDVGLKFLKSNFEDIKIHYGSLNALSNVITSLADRLTSEEQIKDLEKFVKDNREKLKDAADVADTAIAAARQNLAWFQNHEKELSEYLKNYANDNSNGISTYSSGLLISIILFIIRLC